MWSWLALNADAMPKVYLWRSKWTLTDEDVQSKWNLVITSGSCIEKPHWERLGRFSFLQQIIVQSFQGQSILSDEVDLEAVAQYLEATHRKRSWVFRLALEMTILPNL